MPTHSLAFLFVLCIYKLAADWCEIEDIDHVLLVVGWGAAMFFFSLSCIPFTVSFIKKTAIF